MIVKCPERECTLMNTIDMVCRYRVAAATVMQEGIKHPHANLPKPITLHRVLTLSATLFPSAGPFPILWPLQGSMSGPLCPTAHDDCIGVLEDVLGGVTLCTAVKAERFRIYWRLLGGSVSGALIIWQQVYVIQVLAHG